jgi:pimeloyl-ACP methyl ester carboxylesterase
MIERYVATEDGVRLYATEIGRSKAKAIVLCDGLACDGFIWRYLAPRLAEHYRVIHWHYRGHGNSLVPGDHPNIGVKMFARDLRRIFDDFELGEAHLVGHSMGVQVALELALAAPQRLLSLVPICGSYGRPLDNLHGNDLANRAFPYLMRLVRRFPARAQSFWSRAAGMEAVYAYAASREVASHLIRREDFQPYFDHIAKMDIRIFMRLLDDVREHTLETRLHEIHTSTLVVAGERDTVTPVHLSERMAHLLPNATLFVVPEGSHVAPIEQRSLIEQRVIRFLQEGS